MRITEEDIKRMQNPEEIKQEPKAVQEEKSEKEIRKDKRKAEKKKLSELKGRKKLEYLWAYYKWVLAVACGVILVLCVVVSAVRGASAKELLCVLTVDAEMKDPSDESMAKQIKQSIDPKENRNFVTITSNCYTGSDGALDYNSSMLLTVRVASGELDTVILPEKVYRTYNKQGMFLSVEKAEGKDFCKKYAGAILDGNGILMKENTVLKKYGYEFREPMVLAVCANTKHPDNCKTFLKFLGY